MSNEEAKEVQKEEPMEVVEGEAGKSEDSEGKEDGGDLKVLLDLGFPRQACVDALEAAGGNPDQAVEILLTSSTAGDASSSSQPAAEDDGGNPPPPPAAR